MKATVVIIGAGPAGLATSVCLSCQSITNILLEREDYAASLWKKHAYDRLHMHLAKEFCQLPYMPHQSKTPTFMPKNTFINYIDNYISFFKINPSYNRCVQCAFFDKSSQQWIVKAKNYSSGEIESYFAKFLVVATGENDKSFIPNVLGMDSFPGEIIHSSQYKSGAVYNGKDVLVVGSGNSGMEISFDLSNYGARTAIVVRSSYGLYRPSVGPFTHKFISGKAPVIDVGTIKKIRSGKIKVVPAINNVNGNMVVFDNGTKQHFDVIVFATGFRSGTNDWLKDYHYIFNEDGMPKNRIPNHWKGENGIYCVGFARNGLPGISVDAKAVAEDINAILSNQISE
ncbi:probable indole-3-pyruvate monooxygenase YUCCA10 isoform X2 [Ricinus communis]|uniref:probable indole-3-pyruvate monooxygenase YUCCA10 isoform X2 n=1 Tax=Ricinus communis TaxID=3988 RepID=UPI00201ABF9C|nr:probable indole-3-pyruvate monooxygenase YUCCA10 isoform X2 [Ricinus communis]